MRKLALDLVTKMFAGVTDKSGKPYLHHLTTVALRFKFECEDRYVVGLLHDLIEDTEFTEELLLLLFPKRIVDAVVAISKVTGEPYEEYIQRVKANPLAKDVKLSDLVHNMDLSRLPTITPRDRVRHKKYQGAVIELSR